MRAVRHWSVRHARGLETCYGLFERAAVALDPLWRRLGYARIERPVAAVERAVKGFLFDCRMCGQCVLGSTGMSCPMNCPKELRNGPCGGVRADGRCEVDPQMKCVWVEAIEGSAADARRQRGHPRRAVRRWTGGSQGRSSWLAVARDKSARARGGRDEVRRRAGAGLSAADPAGPHLAGAPRARAARRGVRGDDRARPAGLGGPRGRLSPRPRVRRLGRRHQRDRRQRRQLPHVEPRRLRAADPRRLRAGDADLLPRPQPHRDPGRHPRRRRDGRLQHAVPHRRRRAATAIIRRRSRCSISIA